MLVLGFGGNTTRSYGLAAAIVGPSGAIQSSDSRAVEDPFRARSGEIAGRAACPIMCRMAELRVTIAAVIALAPARQFKPLV